MIKIEPFKNLRWFKPLYLRVTYIFLKALFDRRIYKLTLIFGVSKKE